jgi:hypothetical protein
VAYIAKIAQEDIDPTNLTILLPDKGESDFVIGSEFYVWTTETSGGNGLVGRGIASSTSANDRLIHLDSFMLLRSGIYRLEEIRDSRELRDGSLISFLAEKLYYHSHRRVITLPEEFASQLRTDFLRRFLLIAS